jgi:hypothetical protein
MPTVKMKLLVMRVSSRCEIRRERDCDCEVIRLVVRSGVAVRGCTIRLESAQNALNDVLNIGKHGVNHG